MITLYRNWNGGKIHTDVWVTKYAASHEGLILLGTIENGIFSQSQHCPQYLAPTASELTYYKAQ